MNLTKQLGNFMTTPVQHPSFFEETYFRPFESSNAGKKSLNNVNGFAQHFQESPGAKTLINTALVATLTLMLAWGRLSR